MDVIVYSQADGGVSVVVPTGAVSLEEVLKKYVPLGAIDVRVVDRTELPADYTFRDAWEIKNGKVEPNLARSKALAQQKRRESRARQFVPLDIEATIPAKAAQAETKRQAIRDKDATIQSQVDAATDVPTLKTIVGALP